LQGRVSAKASGGLNAYPLTRIDSVRFIPLAQQQKELSKCLNLAWR
jgi:hypothetical protein